MIYNTVESHLRILACAAIHELPKEFAGTDCQPGACPPRVAAATHLLPMVCVPNSLTKGHSELTPFRF